MSYVTKVLALFLGYSLTTVSWADEAAASRAVHAKSMVPAVTSSPHIQTVNINQATPEELMTIEGMTSSKAHAIVVYRTKNGNFKNIEALRKVKGFKKINANKWKILKTKLTI